MKQTITPLFFQNIVYQSLCVRAGAAGLEAINQSINHCVCVQVQLLREMCLVDQVLGQRTVESGEAERLCLIPGLNRFSARRAEEVVPWEFFNKPVFSQFHNNPKRGMEASLSGSLDDAVMQVRILSFFLRSSIGGR